MLVLLFESHSALFFSYLHHNTTPYALTSSFRIIPKTPLTISRQGGLFHYILQKKKNAEKLMYKVLYYICTPIRTNVYIALYM